MEASAADIAARGLRGPSSCSTSANKTSSQVLAATAAANALREPTDKDYQEVAAPSSDRLVKDDDSGVGGQVVDACSAAAYAQVRLRNVEHVLLDVRDQAQFSMCSLPGALNIPVRSTLRNGTLFPW